MTILNSDGRNFGPSLPKATIGAQPSIDDINKQSAWARQNTVTSAVGATISRGPNGTSLLVNKSATQAHPWWVGVSNGYVRVVIGNVCVGGDEKTKVDNLSMVARGETTEVIFNYTECKIANAKYEKENQVWTFPKIEQDGVVWVDGSGAVPELKYDSLSTFNSPENEKSLYVAIAFVFKDGRVVQLVSGDIWGFSASIEDFNHPFKVIDKGSGKIRVIRGQVFSYPNSSTWVDIRGGNVSNKLPNSIKWDDTVAGVGGQYLDDNHCEFIASSYGDNFDLYLKFERTNVKTGEQAGGWDDWTTTVGDFVGWECRLCVGVIGTSQIEGNYNMSSVDPVVNPNYKPLSTGTGTINGTINIYGVPVPVYLNVFNAQYGVKFYSIGKQYYKVASVTKKTVTVPPTTEGGQATIQVKYVATQNLRSDFFFYPPLDNQITLRYAVPTSIGGGHGGGGGHHGGLLGDFQ